MTVRRLTWVLVAVGFVTAHGRAQTTLATPSGGTPDHPGVHWRGGSVRPTTADGHRRRRHIRDHHQRRVQLPAAILGLQRAEPTDALGEQPGGGHPQPVRGPVPKFRFIPRFDLQYDVTDLGFGAAMSAQFLGLSGNLERTVTTAGGAADLLATSDLSFVIVNLVEGTRTFQIADPAARPLLTRLGMADDTFTVSLGTRYAAVRQAWHATLRAGAAVLASADATQSFAGLGLTTLVRDRPPVQRTVRAVREYPLVRADWPEQPQERGQRGGRWRPI